MPSEKDHKLFDGHGLSLFVSAKGSKVWRMAYRVEGKPKTKSLGEYPLTSPAEARVKCAELRKNLQAGVAPVTKRKRAVSTLWQDCETFWNGRQDVTPDYRANALRGMPAADREQRGCGGRRHRLVAAPHLPGLPRRPLRVVPGTDTRSARICKTCKGTGNPKVPFGLEGAAMVAEIEVALHGATCSMGARTR